MKFGIFSLVLCSFLQGCLDLNSVRELHEPPAWFMSDSIAVYGVSREEHIVLEEYSMEKKKPQAAASATTA